MKKRIRIFLGILVFLLLSMTGFIRDTVLFDMTGDHSLVHNRQYESRYRMPVSLDDVGTSFTENPKWFSSVVYSFVFMALSALCIWLFFDSGYHVLLTLGIHFSLMIIAGILILSGLLVHSFHPVYQSAEYIKNLIQSPLLTLILIAGFLLVRRTGQ